ncbi:hypothetical protein HYN56_08475 [Flavobacterium crocinum]|uniref:Acid-shock protein n=1 Tax=Flavobacterium crocinum TaxID=2183896 RepID=A0A2S1YJM1_9FLAO|nr:hypothetical protein [Flavobacterium crocinum]AWK04269.1 hypothetical protein HYN56_08475 [Flavobacterium crocinum]
MKKLAILAVAVLGTFSMVNAQTTPAAPAQSKEVKVAKHDKKGNKKAKGDKKAEAAIKPEAPKAK